MLVEPAAAVARTVTVHVSSCSVERVLLTAAATSGDRFSVVLCTDQTLRITRNDVPLRELSWPAHDPESADECISQFLELTGMH